MIEWNSTQQPYKKIDLLDLAVPLRVACREEQLEDCLAALEEFRVALNGTSQTIDTYEVGFRVGRPATPISPQQATGHSWILIDISIMTSASKNTLYGNNVLASFKMAKTGETLIEVVASDINITTTAENNIKNVTGDVKVSNNKRTLQFIKRRAESMGLQFWRG